MRNDARIDLIRNVWLFERCTKRELDAIAKVATLWVPNSRPSMLSRRYALG